MRVLIVDDSEPIRRLLRVTIERRTTFTIVGEACNGADAIEATERLHSDVVVLDIDMPVMDGVEAATLINRAFPAVHIIVFTSHDADRIAGLLEQGVINGHVNKTATRDLVHQLNELSSS
jgi:DNA-binding NarL/FixJ family response regulator